jgi:aryl-alcohol dehydrogenase-like predicted oxidoreductase
MAEITKKVALGNSDIQLFPIGLGCMGLSEFYGKPATDDGACRLIHRSLELGINFFDTADMYGNGHNEKLLSVALKGKREQAIIATKFGIVREGNEYAREICGRASYLRKACHDSLRRLETDYIDLYYIHRIDASTPIEETVGEMARLVEEGKIRSIGISEPSSATVRRAHEEYPLSAVQSEYSMLTRDPEDEILALTLALGITFVAYSPICRGLLSSTRPNEDDSQDVRKYLPRFQGNAYEKNREIAQQLSQVAEDKKCSLAQLSLAWILAQATNIVPIPGTTKIKNLEANKEAGEIMLTKEDLMTVSEILEQYDVIGDRYTAEGMKGVNL